MPFLRGLTTSSPAATGRRPSAMTWSICRRMRARTSGETCTSSCSTSPASVPAAPPAVSGPSAMDYTRPAAQWTSNRRCARLPGVSIRAKIILIVLPLLVATLVLTSIASSFSARNGITRVAVRFLAFKAQSLRNYLASQWDLLSVAGPGATSPSTGRRSARPASPSPARCWRAPPSGSWRWTAPPGRCSSPASSRCPRRRPSACCGAAAARGRLGGAGDGRRAPGGLRLRLRAPGLALLDQRESRRFLPRHHRHADPQRGHHGPGLRGLPGAAPGVLPLPDPARSPAWWRPCGGSSPSTT